jgi:hypothetical protein
VEVRGFPVPKSRPGHQPMYIDFKRHINQKDITLAISAEKAQTLNSCSQT